MKILGSLALLMIASFAIATHADDKKTDKAEKAEKKDAVKTESTTINTIKLDIPSTWEKETPRGMGRIAQYKIALADGDDKGDIVFYVSQFGGPSGGGGVKANIDRWKKQFKDAEDPAPKTEDFEVGEFKIHSLDITGTYLGGPGGGAEQADHRMLAAIVETKADGNYFVRMIGSKKSVAAQADNFKALLKSVKAE